MPSCKIIFDDYQEPFYSGNSIDGKVICLLSEQENIRGVKIKLMGVEKYESKNDSKRLICVLIKQVLNEAGLLGPGMFEYPFSIRLPKNIPTDYRGFYGGVSYTIEAKVDRPYKLDYTDWKIIKIFSPINLNDMKQRGQLILRPTSHFGDKNVCCLWCNGGAISATVNLEKEAFTRGETVNVKAYVNNTSRVAVKRVTLNIQTKILTRSFEKSRGIPSFKLLATTSSDMGVRSGTEEYFSFALQIPPDADIPNFSSCKLYSSTGYIEVVAVLSVLHLNLKVGKEVVIGHVGMDQIPGKF